MRLAALSLAAVTTVAAVGCRAATEPNAFDIRFSSYIVAVPAGDSLVEAITATGTTGAIVVVGRLKNSSDCFTLTPRVERDGAYILATIDARVAAVGCAAVPTLYGYTLRIGRLPPGDYHLRFAYDVADAIQPSSWVPLDATLHVL